jgi:hypothetical protein
VAALIGTPALAGTATLHRASAAATTMAGDSGTLLAPVNEAHKVGGAIALSPAGSGDYNVSVIVSGLQPNTMHAEHIHAAVYGTPGPIIYPLNTLVGDSKGSASGM